MISGAPGNGHEIAKLRLVGGHISPFHELVYGTKITTVAGDYELMNQLITCGVPIVGTIKSRRLVKICQAPVIG